MPRGSGAFSSRPSSSQAATGMPRLIASEDKRGARSITHIRMNSISVEMPVMTGVELLKRIREKRPEVPAVIVSSAIDQAEAMLADGIRCERYESPLGHGIYMPDDACFHPQRRGRALAERVIAQASTPASAAFCGSIFAAWSTVGVQLSRKK